MVSASQCEAAIRKVEKAVDRIPGALEGLRQRINNDPWIPPEMKNQWLWDKLLDLVRQNTNMLHTFLENARVPFLFDENADKWLKINQKIMKDPDGISAVIQRTVDHSDGVWGGDAGKQYKKGVSRQPHATDAVGGKAHSLMSACNSLRTAGYAFWIGMAAAAVSLEFALDTAETIVGAIAGVLAAVVSIAVGLIIFKIEIDNGTDELKGINGGGSTFGEGWPKAVAK